MLKFKAWQIVNTELWKPEKYHGHTNPLKNCAGESKIEKEEVDIENEKEHAIMILNKETWEEAIEEIERLPPTRVQVLQFIRVLQPESEKMKDKGPLVSLLRMMWAIEEYEFHFLRCSRNNTGNFSLWSKPLISVYDQLDQFKFQNSEEDQLFGKIYLGTADKLPTCNSDKHSVVDKETFLSQFKIFTDGQFEEWDDWNNMVVIGGSMVGSLLPVPHSISPFDYYQQVYSNSDIDVYFYGLTTEEFAKKVDKFYQHLKRRNGEVIVLRTKYTITFCSDFPKRHIQIVVGKWNNISEIVFEPDIDCTSVVFDGTNVWATQRSLFSFNHRCIVTSNLRNAARGFPDYESRLIKYSKRGFYIWDKVMKPDFSNVSVKGLMLGKFRIIENSTVKGRSDVTGLRLILIAFLWSKEMIEKKIRFFMEPSAAIYIFDDEGLPYGPDWNTADILDRITEPVYAESNYYPFQIESPYQLVQNISDWQSIVSPLREELININIMEDELDYYFYAYLNADHTQECESSYNELIRMKRLDAYKVSDFAFRNYDVWYCCFCHKKMGDGELGLVMWPAMELGCDNCRVTRYQNFDFTVGIKFGYARLNSFSKLPPSLSATNLFNIHLGFPLVGSSMELELWDQYRSGKDFPLKELFFTCVSPPSQGPSSPLVIAAREGNEREVKKITTEEGFQEYSYALIAACQEGHPGIVNTLIEAGAHLNVYLPCPNVHSTEYFLKKLSLCEFGCDGYITGTSPLASAIRGKKGEERANLKRRMEVVEILRNKGALVGGPQALQSSLNKNFLSCEMLSLYNKFEPPFVPIEDSIRQNRMDLVKLLCSVPRYIDKEPEGFSRVLSIATEEGNMEMVDFLKDQVNRFLEIHYPLIVAAQKGHVEIAKKLITHGANVDAPSYRRSVVPIVEAVKNGQLEMVKLLVEKGANVNKKQWEGKSALDEAEIRNYKEIFKYLLDHGGLPTPGEEKKATEQM